jgi:hypothetical protein
MQLCICQNAQLFDTQCRVHVSAYQHIVNAMDRLKLWYASCLLSVLTLCTYWSANSSSALVFVLVVEVYSCDCTALSSQS